MLYLRLEAKNQTNKKKTEEDREIDKRKKTKFCSKAGFLITTINFLHK